MSITCIYLSFQDEGTPPLDTSSAGQGKPGRKRKSVNYAVLDAQGQGETTGSQDNSVNGGTKKKRGRPPKNAKLLNETDKSITADKSNTSLDDVPNDTSNNRKGKSKVKNDAVTNLNTSSRGRKRKTLNYSNMDKSGDEDEENNNENEDEDGESRLNDNDSVVTGTTAADAGGGGGSDNDTDDYECERETPVKQKKGQPKPKKGAQIKVWFILSYLGSILKQVVLTFINHCRSLISDVFILLSGPRFVFIFMMSLV